MKLTPNDRKALDLIQDSKDGRRVSTSPRHAKFAIHPSTAARLVRLGLCKTERQLSLLRSERSLIYIHLTEVGREALKNEQT
jgi:hypothetical protein